MQNILKDSQMTVPGANLIRNDIEYTYAGKHITEVKRAHWSNFCAKFYYFEKGVDGQQKLVCRVRHYKTKIWK